MSKLVICLGHQHCTLWYVRHNSCSIASGKLQVRLETKLSSKQSGKSSVYWRKKHAFEAEPRQPPSQRSKHLPETRGPFGKKCRPYDNTGTIRFTEIQHVENVTCRIHAQKSRQHCRRTEVHLEKKAVFWPKARTHPFCWVDTHTRTHTHTHTSVDPPQ